jgi:hypothetical protein
MNREEMVALKVGDEIERSLLGYGHFKRVKITSIFATGVTDNPASPEHGKAYVCLYTEFGADSTMSGSIREGDGRYFRLPQSVT